jgi:hypothetical protein
MARAADGAADPVDEGPHAFALHGLRNAGQIAVDDPFSERACNILTSGHSFPRSAAMRAWLTVNNLAGNWHVL